MQSKALIAVLSIGFATAPAALAQWQPVPLISQQIRDAGVELGGEGAQIVRALVRDSIDGNFVIFGTDVGGLYRSLDGGATWEPANVGYWPRGTAGMAIDPNNPRRVLSVAANSVAFDFHGIWLSTDQAASWNNVLPLRMAGAQDRREQIAFDPNSFDPQQNLTTDVYWSRNGDDKPIRAGWGTPVESVAALYKSTDGGATWTELPDTAHLATGIVRIHPTTRGVIYIANAGGVWRSDNAAGSFTRVFDGNVTGMDISKAKPDAIWITTPDAVHFSPDKGVTWEHIGGDTLKRDGYSLRHLKVSPADPSRMIMWRDDIDGYDETWHYSHDGGRTWSDSTIDSTLAFLPRNERWSHPAWHPTDPNNVINNGGDWPTVSNDGGKTFHWSASGLNAVLVGGSFNFNPHFPDTVFMGSQDYNGAISHDAGHTWTYTNVSGKHWGGYTYGSYAISPTSFVVGEAQSWGGPRQVKVSHDGGKTWTFIDGANYTTRANQPEYPRGMYVSNGDPADPMIVFAGPYRSADGGKTWSLMDGIHGVFTGSAEPRVLFAAGDGSEGGDSQAVYRSTDGGETWEFVVSGNANDIAFDASRNRIYIARREQGLFAHDLTTGETTRLDVPRDQRDSWRIRSVALDPVDPAIMYVAQNKDVYASTVSVTRSMDAGQTWEVLTLQEPLDGDKVDGGRESFWVRVHPKTREPWFITGCYGIWKYAAPE